MTNCFLNFMEGVNSFTPAERAKVSKSFREDIKTYKVCGAIMKIVDSKSDKVPLYVNVMCQQARKKSFLTEFEAECERLRRQYIRSNSETATKIRSLHEIVKDSLK